ncbi:hypothetical protein J6590_083922 [Homalodisca vitripennis]|nr:hypothetical protein J6590_083922 [Homalodisca vitripennis]
MTRQTEARLVSSLMTTRPHGHPPRTNWLDVNTLRPSILRICETSSTPFRQILREESDRNMDLPNISTNDPYYRRKLGFYMFNIHELSTSNSVFYFYTETIGNKGANEVVSFLDNFINLVLDKEIKELFIFCDSCGGQNKNYNLFKYLFFEVHEAKRLEKIQVTFPIRDERNSFRLEELSLQANEFVLPPQAYTGGESDYSPSDCSDTESSSVGINEHCDDVEEPAIFQDDTNEDPDLIPTDLETISPSEHENELTFNVNVSKPSADKNQTMDGRSSETYEPILIKLPIHIHYIVYYPAIQPSFLGRAYFRSDIDFTGQVLTKTKLWMAVAQKRMRNQQSPLHSTSPSPTEVNDPCPPTNPSPTEVNDLPLSPTQVIYPARSVVDLGLQGHPMTLAFKVTR